MNSLLNYLIEANIGLCIFLAGFGLLLNQGTDFKLKRTYLMFAIVASLVFPLLHFQGVERIVPSLGDYLPETWLPEIVVQANGVATRPEHPLSIHVFDVIKAIYVTGVLATAALFLVRLASLLRMIWQSPLSRMGSLRIIESGENKSSFSFFRFIFIGQANQLSRHEKELIIQHEGIHVRQWHSIDMLLVNVLGIFCWFNPIIPIYKKIFIQLHEFEADARAVEDRDLNDYCSLLAKVALLSADYTLANHFSNSLTIKRIEMMRTMKSKIRAWKIAVAGLTVPLFFFVVSCQDQVMEDVTEIAKNSSSALIVPDKVQQRYNQLKKLNPMTNYLLIELNDKAQEKLKAMETTHGLPSSMEIYSFKDGEYIGDGATGNSWAAAASGTSVSSMIPAGEDKSKTLQTFAIIQYTDTAREISGRAMEDQVYTVTEKAAEFVGGIDALRTFLATNLSYPPESRMQGKEGTVFVSFIVNKDGSVSDHQIIKGVDPLMDAEALRVVKTSPNWIPAEQDNKVVRARFVLPIKFKLGNTPPSGESH